MIAVEVRRGTDGVRRRDRARSTTAVALGVVLVAVAVAPTVAATRPLPGGAGTARSAAPAAAVTPAASADWVRQFGGSAFEEGYDVAVYGGGVYYAGTSDSSVGGQSHRGGSDAILARYTLDGQRVWVRQFGAHGYDQPTSVAVDANGVYVAGMSSLMFDQPVSGNMDGWIRRYDHAGNLQWSDQLGDVGTDLAVHDGFAYLLGEVTGAMPDQIAYGERDGFVVKYHPNGTRQWLRQFGTPSGDSPSGIAASAAGVFATGQTDGAFPGQAAAGNGDAFLLRYDHDGVEHPTLQFGTASSDAGASVTATASGVFITGSTGGAFPGFSNAGEADVFVARHEADGDLVWRRQFGTTASDGPWSIRATSSALYVAGGTRGVLVPGSDAPAKDAFLRRYTLDGSTTWTRQFGGPTNADGAAAVAPTGDGVIVAGFVGIGFQGGPLGPGGDDGYLRRYDDAGAVRWTRFVSGATEDIAYGVAGDASAVFVAGYTEGSLPGTEAQGSADGFLRSYSPSGALLWGRVVGYTGRDEVTAVARDAEGVYVAGHTDGRIAPGAVTAGFQDAFVARFTRSGTLVWIVQFGTAGFETVRSIAIDATGVYVGGATDGAFVGQTNAGGGDVFVHRFSRYDGQVAWVRQIGTPADERGGFVAADARGVYLLASTTGALPGRTNAGGSDVLVARYALDGPRRWVTQFGTPGFDGGAAIDASGGVAYAAIRTDARWPGQSHAGGTDTVIRAIRETGATAWTRQFGSTGSDRPVGIDASTVGIHVTGDTLGSFLRSPNAGGRDAFVSRLSTSGALAWTRTYGGAADDHGHGVSASAGGLFVAGTTFGSLPGASSAGRADAFLARIPDAAP